MEWQNDLVPTLSLRRAKEILWRGDDVPYVERFRVVLSLRHLNLRILLHRPILSSYLDRSTSRAGFSQKGAYLNQLGFNSVRICVESAMEVIAITHTIVTSDGPTHALLGAWWYTLYYSKLWSVPMT